MTNSQRLHFFDMPAAVVTAIEAALGSEVLEAQTVAGGFTPGPAARCVLADGRTVFCKGCSNELSPVVTSMHRREAQILQSLPQSLPVPALIAIAQEGGWVAIVSSWFDGVMPAAPYSASDVDRILTLVTELAVAGTPCPIPNLDRVGSAEQERINRWAWRKLYESGVHTQLDDWSRRHLDALIDLEHGWIDAAHGESLLHRDLRADNILFGTDNTLVVDWPVASRGAAWVDLVGLLPSLHLGGALTPHELFENHEVGQAADPQSVNCYLAALAGYFTRQSLQPPPQPGSNVRTFQSAQGSVCRDWLSLRLGWD